MTMRIKVDRTRCGGFGLCEQAAPELLRLNDEAEPEVRVDPVPPWLRDKAEAAARACPMEALSVPA
jgi:ferredoxin